MINFIDSSSNSKCSINEKFFDSWTHESAYVFGLLITDGSMYIKYDLSGDVSQYVLSFKSIDRYLVECINTTMSSSYKVSCFKYNECKLGMYYQLSITNVYICKKLISLGMVQKKSKVVKFPDFIPDEFMPDFVRGVFDGDGCISFSEKWFQFKTFICSGSLDFIIGLNDYLYRIGIEGVIRDKYDVYFVNFDYPSAHKFFSFIYGRLPGGMMYLKRKYDLWVKFSKMKKMKGL